MAGTVYKVRGYVNAPEGVSSTEVEDAILNWLENFLGWKTHIVAESIMVPGSCTVPGSNPSVVDEEEWWKSLMEEEVQG